MKLSQKAVLMRLSLGKPGDEKTDRDFTQEVQEENQLGKDAGKWKKNLYPKEALAPIASLDSKISAYFRSVTVPFDRGIGILPAALIVEFGDRMRQFKGEREALIESHFIANYQKWVDWARTALNGTFDEALYPGPDQTRKEFKLSVDPVPVPESAHFETTVASLLGLDTLSVDARVKSATEEGQRVVLQRILVPVKHMVDTLAKEASGDKPRIYATLTGNIKAICDIAPKLNLMGDPALDKLVSEVRELCDYDVDDLRKDAKTRDSARTEAEAVLRKLQGYNL